MRRLLPSLLLLSTLAVAAPPSVKHQTGHLAKYMLKWQKKLYLNKLHIKLAMVNLEQLPPGAVGTSEISEDPLDIKISVLKAQEYPLVSDFRKVKVDQENTVVHELLHILLNGYSQEHAVMLLSNVFSPQPK